MLWEKQPEWVFFNTYPYFLLTVLNRKLPVSKSRLFTEIETLKPRRHRIFVMF